MFTRTNMSPETKEVLKSMIDGLYGDLVDVKARLPRSGYDVDLRDAIRRTY